MDDDKQIISQLSDLIPELFSGKRQNLKPNGICTPGSGCGPSSGTVETNILKIMTETPTPSITKGGSDDKDR